MGNFRRHGDPFVDVRLQRCNDRFDVFVSQHAHNRDAILARLRIEHGRDLGDAVVRLCENLDERGLLPFELADLAMVFTPQSDLAILNFIANYIIENDRVNWDFVNKHVNFTKTPTDIGYGLRANDPREKAAKNRAKGKLSKISFEEYAKSVEPYTLEYADNASFTASTTVTGITSSTSHSGLFSDSRRASTIHGSIRSVSNRTSISFFCNCSRCGLATAVA